MPKPAPARAVPLSISDNSASILSPSEFASIVQLASNSSRRAQPTAEQQKLALLHSSSTRRASTWNSSLQAQREAKKDKHAREKQQAEEAASRADLAEEEWKAAEQKRMLDRAQAMRYKDRDEVKSLHTAINLAHTIKQREQQIAAQHGQLQRARQLDRQLDEHAEMLRQQAVQAAEQLEAQRRVARKELAVSQLAQLQQYHAHQQAILREEQEDGRATKARQADVEREMEAEESRRQEAQRQLNATYQTANQQQERRRLEREEEEKEHDALIKRYAADKEDTLRMRREREEHSKREKAERTQQMLDAQFKHLQAIKEKEGARLERQVEEEKERVRAVEMRREQLRKERIAEEAESRQTQMARQREEKERREAEERARVAVWEKNAAEAAEKDRLEAISRRQRARETFEQQTQQVAQMNDRLRRDNDNEAEELAREKLDAHNNVEQFDVYARERIGELQSKGLSVTPVRLALEAEKTKQTRLRV